MSLRKFFASAFMALVLIINLFALPASAMEYPEIDAAAAILLDADNGTVYYSLNENDRREPASLVKIMTALLALEAVDRGEASLDELVTASETAINAVSDPGGSDGIKPGEVMTLESLLYCTLVASMNEASNVIAEHISGSIDAFVAQMNTRAMELGCKNTHFTNTHGQTSPGQYSSAYDIALISAEAVKNPTFDEIVNTISKEIPPTNLSDIRYITNSNKLISPDSTRFYYSEASGIKTGSTYEAGFCLASSIVRDDMNVVSVVLGCKQIEVEGGYYDTQSFVETKKLLKWLLDNFQPTKIVSKNDLICEIPVLLGEGMDSVVIRPDSEISVLLPKDFDKSSVISEVNIFSAADGSEPFYAPIEEGVKVGELKVSCNGVDYPAISLVTNTSVSRSRLAYLKYLLSNFLSNRWVKLALIGVVVLIVLYIILVIRYNIVRSRRIEAAKKNKGTANSMPKKKK